MKTLKVLLQEVVSGIKAWVNSNFAQESNTVHKTGNETVNGVKTFTGATYKNSLTAYEDSGVSGYDYAPGSYKSVDTFIHRGVDHLYWGGLKHNWLSDGTSQTRFAVSNYRYANNTWNQGFWAVDLSASKDFYVVELVPSVTNGINLGSSSYQWNSLYAKNYYYNGTAWGLDKANFWTGTNKFYGITITGHSGIRWLRDGYTAGTLPETTMYYGFQNSYDSNEDVFDRIRSYISTTGTNLQEHIKYAWNDLTKYAVINFWINADGSDSEYKLSVNRVIPAVSNITDLGNSTHKWKTFNGVNPGALSLPNLNYTDTNQWISINGNVTDETGGENEYDPAVDGWVVIYAKNNPTSLRVNVHARRPSIKKYLSSATGVATPDGTMIVSVPAPAGSRVYIYFNKGSGSLDSATFITCQGNV